MANAQIYAPHHHSVLLELVLDCLILIFRRRVLLRATATHRRVPRLFWLGKGKTGRLQQRAETKYVAELCVHARGRKNKSEKRASARHSEVGVRRGNKGTAQSK